jgi:proline iminopeptidase
MELQEIIEPIPVLWMDDKPEEISRYQNILKSETVPLDISISTSIDDANEQINEKSFSGLVIDCRMNVSNSSENGAAFLKRINTRKKYLPTFVYTAFRNDPRYKKYLIASYAITIAERTQSFRTPLISNDFFRKMLYYTKKYNEVKNFTPEKIEFRHYLKRPEEFKVACEAHWQKHQIWITIELKRKKWVWGIVCGMSLVCGSSNLFDFPSEDDLMELGKEKNLIPFAYTIANSPESSDLGNNWNWNKTPYNENDFYPALKAGIRDSEYLDDFDTGAQQTCISDSIIERGILNFLQQDIDSEHLGSPYKYFTKKVGVTIQDNSGIRIEQIIPLRVIDNWGNSPFVMINPNRRVLFGRDILQAFELEVRLNSQKKISNVSHLNFSTGTNNPENGSKHSSIVHSGQLRVSRKHTIYYEDRGNSTGKPVVVLHGGPGAGISYRNLQFFDPQRYRIILFDQRGAGKSRPHASIDENTTQYLVEDIEKLRNRLHIDRWQVFGGSWGSTLALAYAQSYPGFVTELILRGIFLLQRWELEWFYQHGANLLFPDAWQEFIDPVLPEDRNDMMAAYHNLLNSYNPEIYTRAARAWSRWEAILSSIIPDVETIERAKSDEFCISFARIENHYFVNGGFFNPETQLLDNLNKIRHIPAIAIQGRYDVVCPAQSAWDLKQKWPELDLRIVEGSGHSAFEHGIASELIKATTQFLNN